MSLNLEKLNKEFEPEFQKIPVPLGNKISGQVSNQASPKLGCTVIRLRESFITPSPFTPFYQSLAVSTYQTVEQFDLPLKVSSTSADLVQALNSTSYFISTPIVMVAPDRAFLPAQLLQFCVDSLDNNNKLDGLRWNVMWGDELSGELGSDRPSYYQAPSELDQLFDLLAGVIFTRQGFSNFCQALVKSNPLTQSDLLSCVNALLKETESCLKFESSQFKLSAIFPPAPFDILRNEGVAAINSGQNEKASECIRRAYEVNPASDELTFLTGITEAKLGNLWAAKLALNKEQPGSRFAEPAKNLAQEIEAIVPSKEFNYSQIRGSVEGIKGYMIPGQEQFLFELTRSLPNDAVIAEIGSLYGRSTAAIGLACVDSDRKIFCLDTFCWNSGVIGGAEDWQELFEFNMARLGLLPIITPLKGRSTQTLAQWGDKPLLDFIFIDGSHFYQDVILDFELAYSVVKPGGIIAFHDVAPNWPGCWRVWREVAMPLLSDHCYSSTLACGRKIPGMPFSKKPPTNFVMSEDLLNYLSQSRPELNQINSLLRRTMQVSGSQNIAPNERSMIARMPQDIREWIKALAEDEISSDRPLQEWNALLAP